MVADFVTPGNAFISILAVAFKVKVRVIRVRVVTVRVISVSAATVG